MKIVVFLQNAWSPLYAGGTWPRRSWLKALAASRSGQRLRSMESSYCYAGAEWWYDNTTPIVGDCPDSVVKPDTAHMVDVVECQKPDVIVLCGKQAEKAGLSLGFKQTIVVVPHPAHRVLTNLLYEKAGSDISLYRAGFEPAYPVITYRQERGGVVVTPERWWEKCPST